ncbi:hypothetical protein [Microlunatus sp. Gsoil 973]|uniref:hypothetical protein n=1 Tax=Microlunatus sp. Gsoil 973 TaxID=2672569 RepID=UPI0012B440DE|nr:hypothetical protein [Microlunatus sp. Gsoil 973]QGN32115.1 hypothetical protein GJV80_04125 [Microlunatus sp. Gsoil 973]
MALATIATAGCTSPAGHGNAERSASASPSTAVNSAGTRPPRRSPIRLSCADQLGGEASGSATLGLGSDAWQHGISARDFRTLPKNGEYTFFKTYTYVTPHATKTTTLRVLQPSTALLYYTDRQTWQNGPSDQEVLREAAHSVTLTRCGSDSTGYAGGILVHEPRCVTLDILQRGKPPQHRRVKVPVGKPC